MQQTAAEHQGGLEASRSQTASRAERIHFCCFQPPGVWWSVTVVLGHEYAATDQNRGPRIPQGLPVAGPAPPPPRIVGIPAPLPWRRGPLACIFLRPCFPERKERLPVVPLDLESSFSSNFTKPGSLPSLFCPWSQQLSPHIASSSFCCLLLTGGNYSSNNS